MLTLKHEKNSFLRWSVCSGEGGQFVPARGGQFSPAKGGQFDRFLQFNTEPYPRTKITEGLCIPEDSDFSKEVNEESTRLFKEYNVMGTPTFFINGYKLPSQYEIDDIRYFMEIFKEREEVKLNVSTVD